MAFIPCNVRVICPPGAGATGDLEFDSPLANFSSEAPDPDLFFGNNFGWDLNVPKLGWQFTNTSNPGFCSSAISQADADQCAVNQQIVNTYQGGVIPTLQNWKLPNGQPAPVFTNQTQSCSWTCPDGLLFTWTVAAGYVVTGDLQKSNAIAFSIACQNAAAHHLCLSNIPNGCINQAYATLISVDAGIAAKAPFTFTIIAGSLPAGMVMAQTPTTALISGTPLVAGNYSFTLRVTDANGNFMQKVYNLPVLSITNVGSLPTFGVGIAYSQQLTVAGGKAPYTFTLAAGSLPTGITLSSTGLISGTATSSANATFTVRVVDSQGFVCNQSGTLINTPCAPFFAGMNWSNASSFAQNNATFSASILNNVVTLFGTVASNALSSTQAQVDAGFATVPISSPTALDCTVTVQVNQWTGGNPPQSSFFLLVNDLNAGVILSVSQGVPTNGSYPIHIPAGDNLEVICQVVFSSGNGPSFAGAFNVVITLGA